jgi:hypothetical protein
MTDFLTNLAHRMLAPEPAIRPVTRLFFPGDVPAAALGSDLEGPLTHVLDTAGPPAPDPDAPSAAAAPRESASAVADAGGEYRASGPDRGPGFEEARSGLDEPAADRATAANLPSSDPAGRGQPNRVRQPFRSVSDEPARPAGTASHPGVPEAEGAAPAPRPNITADSPSRAAPSPLVAAPRPGPARETDAAPPATSSGQPEPVAMRPTPAERAEPAPRPNITGDSPSRVVLSPLVAAPGPGPALQSDPAQPSTKSAQQLELVAVRPTPTAPSSLQIRPAEKTPAPRPDPVVQISIGRVEVRAVAPASQGRGRPPAARQPGLSLEEYLKQRA